MTPPRTWGIAALPGWALLLCGLALVIAAIAVPAEQDLGVLREQLARLDRDQALLLGRLQVHQAFIDELDAGTTNLAQRVADMQWRRGAGGDRVLLDRGAPDTPVAWLDHRGRQARIVEIITEKPSMLALITDGRGRLWTAAGGVMLVFIGLLWEPGGRGAHFSRNQSPQPAGT